MIMAQEQEIFKAEKEFSDMVAEIRKAAAEGRQLDQVERNLWQQMLSLGQKLMQGFVDLQGSGDLGATLEHEGRKLHRLENYYERRLVTVFGEVQVKRTVYGTRESQKHEVVPLDARLSLPDSEFSYFLQEWDQEFCLQGSYQEGSKKVKRILGIGQSVRSLEHMNRSMAKDVEAFRESQEASTPKEKAPILVISADGKGVPMRRQREEPTNKSARRKKGEKANKKRMACVGAVYTIDPFVRCSDDVVNEVMRKECQKNRPIPQNKQVHAELTRVQNGKEVNAKDAIFSWFAGQITARNRGSDKQLVCLMDGERALWKTLKNHISNAVCILDLFHVMERLWTSAHCFYQENSDEAEAFVTARLERILQGGVGRVIGGLKQMSTKNNLRGGRKKRLDKVIGYLQNNRWYMAYDEYLAKGYPIGSGVVEGACRHLVKDRMELTGMRWITEGAQAMLNLRATYLNGDWDNFQQHRIDADYHKLYPYRETVEANWLKAA